MSVFGCWGCGGVDSCSCGVPPLGFEREPQEGGTYVIQCAGCERKIFSHDLECICPHCGSWLDLKWQALPVAIASDTAADQKSRDEAFKAWVRHSRPAVRSKEGE